MIYSGNEKFYSRAYESYLVEYLEKKIKLDRKLRMIFILFFIALLIYLFGLSMPIFASSGSEILIENDSGGVEYLEEDFVDNIKEKYRGYYVSFPYKGVAHIKQVRYINSKPIKINIVELNTNVNRNLKIQPEISSNKLNSKSSVRKIAQSNGGIIAINGGFFKPQNGIPLGALVIDGKVLTGPIYNRVAMGIFENGNQTYFKMAQVAYDIKAYTKSKMINIDNINQPRMLSTYTLLYTPVWGESSPVAPKHCYNVLIQNNKAVKISANPIKMSQNDMVIQGNKELMRQIIRDREIYVDIKLPSEMKHAKHIIGAGPYLVKDSQIYVDVKTQKLHAIQGKNPRSAIGYKNDGTLIIVTVDGREKDSVGMTLFETAKLMKGLGCEFAMNFDGGSSSALYVKGRIVNDAVNKEGIAVSNALVVSLDNPDEMKISSID